jgi:hypothetical protein
MGEVSLGKLVTRINQSFNLTNDLRFVTIIISCAQEQKLL